MRVPTKEVSTKESPVSIYIYPRDLSSPPFLVSKDGCQNAIGDESDSQSSRTNENANEQGANEPEGEDFSGSGLIVQHCRDLSGEVKEGGE